MTGALVVFVGALISHALLSGLVARSASEALLDTLIAQSYVRIADAYLVDGDRVFYLDTREALLRGRLLPSMLETAPLSIPRAEHGQLLWLERPGIARLATLPRRESYETFEADIARAKAAAITIELP